MNADAYAAGGHAEHHGHEADSMHATFRGYLTGFVLSVILTAIPFWLVMSGTLGDKHTVGLVIMAFAAVQIVVHMVFFLHMDTRAQGGWIMLALIFTLIMVAIALVGSLWVMYHLNVNMMPSMQDMRNMP